MTSEPTVTLYCAHGEAFPDYPADHVVCTYCCTPYPRGGYREHCAESPSHLDERAARHYDRAIERDRARGR